jgi:hypothetical protein
MTETTPVAPEDAQPEPAPEPPIDCDRPNRPERHWLDNMAVLAAAFAAVAAAATAGVGLWQVCIARDAEHRQLRAYMAVDPMPVLDFGENTAPIVGALITVKGQTPAYNITLITHIATLPYPLHGDIRSIPSPPVGEVTSSMLSPSQSAHNRVALAYSPDPSQFATIKASKTHRLFVWGEVHYKDAFKAMWHNRFCYSYDASARDGAEFEACPTGNCADDQCDK